jgi:hypothetical protein
VDWQCFFNFSRPRPAVSLINIRRDRLPYAYSSLWNAVANLLFKLKWLYNFQYYFPVLHFTKIHIGAPKLLSPYVRRKLKKHCVRLRMHLNVIHSALHGQANIGISHPASLKRHVEQEMVYAKRPSWNDTVGKSFLAYFPYFVKLRRGLVRWPCCLSVCLAIG